MKPKEGILLNKMFNQITTDTTYRGYPIQAGTDRGYQCYELLLDETIDRLLHFTQYTTKVFVMRFDLRFSDGFNSDALSFNGNSALVSEFFRRLSTHLKRKTAQKTGMPYRNHKHIAFHWVREVDTAKNCHFHCWIALDGQKVQHTGLASNGSGIMGVMDRIWSTVCKGHGSLYQVSGENVPTKLFVDAGTREYKDKGLLAETVYALSYLSKTRTKFSHKTAAFERIYGGSRYR
jgi:hypothetical protein